MSQTKPVPRRVRDAILQSLRAGVVPRVGQQHIQVGRAREVHALVGDIERIADGGSAIRFVIGEYGSGKTFFLHLVRSIALEKRLVTAHADLTPDRRLHATGGQARALYQEMMRNLATRAKPDGAALPSVVERFISASRLTATQEGRPVDDVIRSRLSDLSEMVGGFDFAEVIAAYWRGHDTGNDLLKANAVRWLRAEFTTKTAAKQALGVGTIIDDANVYDMLKLFAEFVTMCGYEGLLVCWDELVNLFKLSSGRARKSNYEQILRILNDSLQGPSRRLGILLGGTPELLYDTRKGLFSYEALQTRLAQNTFATDGLVDYSGPVLQLENLSPEDLYVLLQKIRDVQASGDREKHLVSDSGLEAFMQHCAKQIGAAYFRTPRNTIKQFVSLLAVLEQNLTTSFESLLGAVSLEEEGNPDLAPLEEEDEGENENEDDDGDEDWVTNPPPAVAPAIRASASEAAPGAPEGVSPRVTEDDDDELANFSV